ncbi:MAG: sulfotransferase [Candidatus Caenarcaniphilales bacterium]|nr:sulfotransferase [Candidatus Caenarcaniphilales bacterium]
MSKLVIGLGSGRSGSQSLAKLLSAQKNACFTHELLPIPWTDGDPELRQVIAYFRAKLSGYDLVGDSASYYLPYVEHLLETFPESKLICLERDRADTVKSFLAKTGLHHNWLPNNGVSWRINLVWDSTFPKYPIEDKKEAIGRYWDEYYNRARDLAERHPGNFAIFKLAELNHEAGQKAILTFLGITDPILAPGVKANALLS